MSKIKGADLRRMLSDPDAYRWYDDRCVEAVERLLDIHNLCLADECQVVDVIRTAISSFPLKKHCEALDLITPQVER